MKAGKTNVTGLGRAMDGQCYAAPFLVAAVVDIGQRVHTAEVAAVAESLARSVLVQLGLGMKCNDGSGGSERYSGTNCITYVVLQVASDEVNDAAGYGQKYSQLATKFSPLSNFYNSQTPSFVEALDRPVGAGVISVSDETKAKSASARQRGAKEMNAKQTKKNGCQGPYGEGPSTCSKAMVTATLYCNTQSKTRNMLFLEGYWDYDQASNGHNTCKACFTEITKIPYKTALAHYKKAALHSPDVDAGFKSKFPKATKKASRAKPAKTKPARTKCLVDGCTTCKGPSYIHYCWKCKKSDSTHRSKNCPFLLGICVDRR
jgi:hypothetical protein